MGVLCHLPVKNKTCAVPTSALASEQATKSLANYCIDNDTVVAFVAERYESLRKDDAAFASLLLCCIYLKWHAAFVAIGDLFGAGPARDVRQRVLVRVEQCLRQGQGHCGTDLLADFGAFSRCIEEATPPGRGGGEAGRLVEQSAAAFGRYVLRKAGVVVPISHAGQVFERSHAVITNFSTVYFKDNGPI